MSTTTTRPDAGTGAEPAENTGSGTSASAARSATPPSVTMAATPTFARCVPIRSPNSEMRGMSPISVIRTSPDLTPASA